MKYLIFLPALLLLAACKRESAGPEKPAPADLKKELPGTWEIIHLKVDVNTFDNDPDSSFVFEVREENWEKWTQVKPARTFFEAGNQYHRVFRTLKGDTMGVTRGMWNVFGDTLMLIEPDTSYSFIVSIANGLSEYHRRVDWDRDGQEDDEYLEIHRRISRSTKDQ